MNFLTAMKRDSTHAFLEKKKLSFRSVSIIYATCQQTGYLSNSIEKNFEKVFEKIFARQSLLNELPRRKQRGIKNRIDAIAGYASADIFQGPVLAL